MNRIYTCVYGKNGRIHVGDVVCQSDDPALFVEAANKLQLRSKDQIFAMVPGQHSSYTLLPAAAESQRNVSTADLDARDRIPAHHLNKIAEERESIKDYVPPGF